MASTHAAPEPMKRQMPLLCILNALLENNSHELRLDIRAAPSMKLISLCVYRDEPSLTRVT